MTPVISIMLVCVRMDVHAASRRRGSDVPILGCMVNRAGTQGRLRVGNGWGNSRSRDGHVINPDVSSEPATASRHRFRPVIGLIVYERAKRLTYGDTRERIVE